MLCNIEYNTKVQVLLYYQYFSIDISRSPLLHREFKASMDYID